MSSINSGMRKKTFRTKQLFDGQPDGDNFDVKIVEQSVILPIEKTWPPDDSQEYIRSIHFLGKTSNELQVVLEELVWLDVFEHATSHSNQEIGGILLGEYFCDKGKKYVLVQHALSATQGQSFSGAFIFTLDALIELERQREILFPRLRVLGWYHSHPGFGVFYSSIDAFSHRTQFTAPFHIGMVVDPLDKKAGFFTWLKNQLVGPHGYWVVTPNKKPEPDTEGKSIQTNQ